MKRLSLSSLSLVVVAGLCLSSLLTGCALNSSFPDVAGTTSDAQSHPGGFSGSNFGGHAPIANAHVYLLQAGTTGYGSTTTSLLTSAALATGSYGTAGGADTTIVGSTSSPAYYVTTNAAGFFNITGDYTCTPGLPVFIYALGGAPDTGTVQQSTYISSATGNGTTTTFTVNNEKFYVGQSVSFANIPAGNPWVALNGTTQTVTAISTTANNTFSIASSVNATSSNFGQFAGVVPVGANNPGIANVALLGNCPATQSITAIPAGSGQQTLTGISATDIAKLTVGESIAGPGVLPSTIASIGTSSITITGTETGGNGTSSFLYAVGNNDFSHGQRHPIKFVYLNEVSTVAAMYVLAPFSTSSTIATAASTYPTYNTGGNVTVIGYGTSRTIGIPAATAQTAVFNSGTNTVSISPATGDQLALTAIENAANNAAQLYDITGAAVNTYHGAASTSVCQNNSSPTLSTDGENYTACTGIINNGGGNGSYGIVPNALINTLANILASCVDSPNQYGLGNTGGTVSSTCNTLFLNTNVSGTVATSLSTGGVPNNTASAALGMALHPAEAPSTLFALQTGVVPFTPDLSAAPNDFAIGINIYLNPAFLSNGAIPRGIATDAAGNAIINTSGCTNGCTIEITPRQQPATSGSQTGEAFTTSPYGVALGPGTTSFPVWVSNGTNATGTGFNPVGTYFYGTEPTLGASPNSFTGYTPNSTDFGKPTSVAVDGNGYAYFADNSDSIIYKVTAAGATPVQINNSCNTYNMNAIAIDSQANGYNIWATNSGNRIGYGVCELNNAGTTVLTQNGGNGGNWNGVAIDYNDNGWVTADGGALYQWPGNGGVNQQIFSLTGNGGINVPNGVAIDGNDSIWVANSGNNSVSNLINTGTAKGALNTSTTSVAVSPSTGYTASGMLATPAGIAIDPSGDVWVINQGTITGTGSSLGSTNGGVGSVTELIGIAAPSYLPLSSAALNNTIGTKP